MESIWLDNLFVVDGLRWYQGANLHHLLCYWFIILHCGNDGINSVSAKKGARAFVGYACMYFRDWRGHAGWKILSLCPHESLGNCSIHLQVGIFDFLPKFSFKAFSAILF